MPLLWVDFLQGRVEVSEVCDHANGRHETLGPHSRGERMISDSDPKMEWIVDDHDDL